jgi:transposase-like protein
MARQQYQIIDDMFGRLIPTNEPFLTVYLSGSFLAQAINAPILPMTKYIDNIDVTRSSTRLSPRRRISASSSAGRWRNNRAENSHQPTRRRERKTQGFKSVGSAQRFLSVHAATQNTFNFQRHLTSTRTHRVFRASAMQAWREVVAAA